MKEGKNELQNRHRCWWHIQSPVLLVDEKGNSETYMIASTPADLSIGGIDVPCPYVLVSVQGEVSPFLVCKATFGLLNSSYWYLCC